jgi:hypothetical protein
LQNFAQKTTILGAKDFHKNKNISPKKKVFSEIFFLSYMSLLNTTYVQRGPEKLYFGRRNF